MKLLKSIIVFIFLFLGAILINSCGTSKSSTTLKTEDKVQMVSKSEMEEAKNQATGYENNFKLDYEKFTLENGLDVVLHKDNSDPIVSVAILYHVGSNREKPGRTGFAHFFEHMLFQASENVGKGEFFKRIDEFGGDFNGGTWNDGTIYYEVVPKDALEKVLWMESDRMGFFINTVTVPALENEKQVVKNEKRQRVDNRPYGHTNYVIDKALYPEDHPYNWQVIGSLDDLQNATLDDVKEFYETWYGPNNATIVIAGDFDEKEVKNQIRKYFEEIPAKKETDKITPRLGKLANTIKLYHEDNFAKLPELTLVFPSVEEGHPDSYALNYLGELLSEGKRAPFYKEIVVNQKLAPSTVSYNRAQEVAGKFIIKITGNEGTDLDDIHAGVFKALTEFENTEIDDKDMERIKNSQETSFYNDVSSLLSKSFQLAAYNEFFGDPGYASKDIKKILAVTKKDVVNVYEKYIKGKNYIATSFVPKGNVDLILEGSAKANVVEEAIVTGAEEPAMVEGDLKDIKKTPSNIDRTVEPPFGPAPTANTPNIWTTTLSNGMKAYGIQNEELPIVEFSFRLNGGLTLDNPKKIGAANLITDMLQEGTLRKTPEELQDNIGRLGATIRMTTSPEYITVSANCLARNYEKVLALVEEMILNPRWDENEFARVKKSTITAIQQQSVQPNAIARNVSNKLLFGKDHILAQNTMGTIESVKAITIEDLKAYYEKAFSPSVTSFHIAGGISETRAKASLKSFEINWANKVVEFPEFNPLSSSEGPQLYFVDIPNAKQSVIRIVSPSVAGNNPDYYRTSIVNNRLGSGSSGRLFQTLREEKGYTYGAYSSFPRRVDQGYFVGFSSVRANVTLESVQTFLDVLRKYKGTYTQEDLSKTKNSLSKSNALEFETLDKKIGLLQNISTYGLPMDYIKRQEKVLAGMDLSLAKQLIGKYINPNKMIYLIVGDKATQFDRLKEAGLGAPVLIDRDGNPIK